MSLYTPSLYTSILNGAREHKEYEIYAIVKRLKVFQLAYLQMYMYF